MKKTADSSKEPCEYCAKLLFRTRGQWVSTQLEAEHFACNLHKADLFIEERDSPYRTDRAEADYHTWG